MAGLLDYQHVEISFNGNAVVHDVTFQLHPGEILGSREKTCRICLTRRCGISAEKRSA